MTTPTPEPAIYADRDTAKRYRDAFEMLNDYLERFAQSTAHLPVRLDAAGYAQLKRGAAHIGVNVIEEQGLLMLLAPVGEVPKKRREAFYRTLLEMSFLATADAAFAIDGTNDVVYVRAIRRLSALDYEEFADLLGSVARVADEWEKRQQV